MKSAAGGARLEQEQLARVGPDDGSWWVRKRHGNVPAVLWKGWEREGRGKRARQAGSGSNGTAQAGTVWPSPRQREHPPLVTTPSPV